MKTVIPFSPLPAMNRKYTIRLCTAKFPVILFPVILLSAFLTGCIRQEFREPNLPKDRTFTLNYSFDRPQTRGVAANGNEKTVNDVAFIFYKAEDESYVTNQTVTIPGGSGSTTGSFPLQLPEKIVQGTEYKVIIVGNYARFRPAGLGLDDFIYSHSGLSFTQMKEFIYSQSVQGARLTVPLPFCGILTGSDGKETTLTGPSPTTISLGVSVKFSRAVARIDLRHLAAKQLVIKWVKVCNYRDRGYLYHQDAPAGQTISGIASVPPSDGTEYPAGYVKAYPPVDGENGTKRQDLTEGGLYAYPNIVGYTAQDDNVTTFLMIAGYYQPEGGPENTTRLSYYRANIGSNGASQILKRNYAYTVVINSVKKEGANSESGAASEKEKLLEYAVDDAWEDDDSNTNVDGQGNFLTLSKTSLLLGNEAGESGVIKVSVKTGTSWVLQWKQNPTDAFRYEKVNDNTFSIIANRDNQTQFSNNGVLEVRVTGITPEPEPPLAIDVDVIQLSTVADSRTLIVQGHTGDFSYTVPGQGAVVAFQVITGSSSSRWQVEGDAGLNEFVAPYETSGSNKSYIQLNFLPNAESTERTGKLTVHRLTPGGSIDNGVTPVVISFRQETTPYPLTINPDFSNSTLEIDAFTPSNANPNGVVYTRGFVVKLADPSNYTFTAKSTFNKNADAYLSLGSTYITKATAHQSNSNPNVKNEVTGGRSGQSFYLHVFNAGPGDPELSGTITVIAVPKASSGLMPFELSFPVKIKSSCKLGNTPVGTLLWADRNVGAPLKTDSGEGMKGLNYTNEGLHNDHVNFSYKGAYFNFAEARTEFVCPQFGIENYKETGWRLPDKTEQEALKPRMRYSKVRAFILSDVRAEDGSYTGCWLPQSGENNSQSGIYGQFWSSTTNNVNPSAYSWSMRTDASTIQSSLNVTSSNQSNGYTVRCVREKK